MAIRLGDVFIALQADDSGLDRDLSAAKQKTTSWANSVGGTIGNVFRGATERVGQLATEAVINAGRAAVGFMKDSISEASNLNESLSKATTVFGDQSDAILEWSKNSSTAIGQSRQQALEAVGTFGNLFDALGMTGEETENMSIGLVELASDLASFNNISTDEALIKLRAGIVGETEPLRTLGVNLSATAVELKALEMGLANTKAEISETDKVTARYAIIMEQTKNAQGDFARTSDGLANSQRILAAQWTDIKATVGTAVMPVIVEMAAIFKDLATAIMPGLASFLEGTVTPAFKNLAQGIKDVAANSAFKWTPEIKQVKLGDFFEFIDNDKLTYINLGEYVSFVYNKTSGNVDIKVTDLFSFISNESLTYVNLADYVSFVYNKTSGAVDIKIGDLFSLSTGDAGAQINLANYITFIYDNPSGALALKLGDVFTFVSDSQGSVINLADYVTFTYKPNEKVKITVKDIVEFDADIKEDRSTFKLDLASFIAFTSPVTSATLFNLSQAPATFKLSLGDFFGWVTGQEKTTTDDLFDLSAKPAPSPYQLRDFFDWMTGTGDQAAKITFGDLFSFEFDTEQNFAKIKIGDLFEFGGQSGEGVINLADFLKINFDPSGITKLQIGDIIDVSDTGTLSASVGEALSQAASKLGEALEAPPWLQNLIDWKVPDDVPAWLSNLFSWAWPDLSESSSTTLNGLVAWKWPDVPTSLDELLAWAWPDMPSTLDELLAWVWPDFSEGLMSAINSIIAFQWPKFERPAWIDSLLNFSFPTPGWVSSLLSFQWPALNIPDWLQDLFGASASAAGVGASSLGAMAPTINIGPVYVRSEADIEAITYQVATRLAAI